MTNRIIPRNGARTVQQTWTDQLPLLSRSSCSETAVHTLTSIAQPTTTIGNHISWGVFFDLILGVLELFSLILGVLELLLCPVFSVFLYFLDVLELLLLIFGVFLDVLELQPRYTERIYGVTLQSARELLNEANIYEGYIEDFKKRLGR